LDDLEGQYCNKNCIGCSERSFLATAGLSCYKLLFVEGKRREEGRKGEKWKAPIHIFGYANACQDRG